MWKQHWRRMLITAAMLVATYGRVQRPTWERWLPLAPQHRPMCVWSASWLPVPEYPGSWLQREAREGGHSTMHPTEESSCLWLTLASPDEIQAFYDERMQRLGWTKVVRGADVHWESPPPAPLRGFISFGYVTIYETRHGVTRYGTEMFSYVVSFSNALPGDAWLVLARR